MKKINKYEQLAIDLKKAIDATESIDFGADYGTCNGDCPAIFLPRWNEEKTNEAAQVAGSYAVKCETGFFKGAYTFVIPGISHANARSRRVDAIVAALVDMGYRACAFCEAD